MHNNGANTIKLESLGSKNRGRFDYILIYKGRLQKQKTVLCGNNSHVGRPPPPPPRMGIFSTKCRFFSEDVPNFFFLKIKYVFLAPQGYFGMQKKNLVNKHKQVGMGQTPPPSMGNIPT